MDSVEIVVLLLFGIVVAGLIIGFFAGIDFVSIQESIFKIFIPEPETSQFQKLNFTQLLGRMNNCWQKCGLGASFEDCGTIELNTEGLTSAQISAGLTAADIEGNFERLNFCTGCSIEVQNSPIMPPALVHIACNVANNHKLTLN